MSVELGPEIRAAATRLELKDPESSAKEADFVTERQRWWGKIMNKFLAAEGRNSTDQAIQLEGLTDRQLSLYDLEHHPELSIPLLTFEAATNAEATGRVLAAGELAAMDVDPEIKAQARPILEQVGVRSFKNYTEYDWKKEAVYFQEFYNTRLEKLEEGEGRILEDDEIFVLKENYKLLWSEMDNKQRMPTVRAWAIDAASDSGIDAAPDLVKAITGERRDPLELLANLSLDDMVGEVVKNLSHEVDLASVDKNQIKTIILELARDPSSWVKPEGLAMIEKVMSNEILHDQAHQADVEAMMVVVMGIHLSWEGIQGPRSVEEQADLYYLAQRAKVNMTGTDLVQRYSNLRTFRPVNRSVGLMQANKFLEGSTRESQGQPPSVERGLALAVFEVLKDLVQLASVEE